MNDNPKTTHLSPREAFGPSLVAAARESRPIAVVLGMHRSGTSLCAHILSAMGIDMADDIDAVASNAKGHWERLEIVQFHERILQLFNREFFSPLHDFPLPAAWWADPRVCHIRREIVAFLANRMGDGYFGFKDPRTVRLMPLWYQIFSDLKLAPKIVLCVRNPAQVARSLKERDNLDPALGEYRWLMYMVDFFRYCWRFQLSVIEYNDWFTNPHMNFEKIRKLLDVQWQQSSVDLDLVLSSVIDPALRHDEPHSEVPRERLVCSVYRLVCGFGREGVTRDEIEKFVREFLCFQISQTPLHQVADSLAVTAARHPELELHAAGLRAEVEQRAATEAQLRAEIEQRAVTEAQLRAEIEQRAATEAQLWAEIGELEATGAVLRAQLEVFRVELLTAEERTHQSEVTTTTLLAQMSSMQSELQAAREVGRAALEALRDDPAILGVFRNKRWWPQPLRGVGLWGRDQML